MSCCRHNILMKALNMNRGEIFAYPLLLQLYMQQVQEHTFVAQDTACTFRPWLEKLALKRPDDQAIQNLLQQKPFLSVMHAYAHSWYCQVIISFNYVI